MDDKFCKNFCYKKNRKKRDKNIPKMKNLELVIFDMDGVLADTISSWKFIHDYFNTSNEKSVIDYLNGKIDDSEFIKRDAALWSEDGEPISEKKIKEILFKVPIIKGAQFCISTLKKRKIKTAIVSAGLDILAQDISKKLDIDYVYSNGIEADNKGRLTGKGIIQVRLLNKDQTVIKLANRLNITYDKIAAVGNSCYDIPMFDYSGLSIAFNPDDDCVKEAADIVILEKDLSKIIPPLEKYFIK